MGHLINPISFRLGFFFSNNSVWSLHQSKKTFNIVLHKDLQIYQFLFYYFSVLRTVKFKLNDVKKKKKRDKSIIELNGSYYKVMNTNGFEFFYVIKETKKGITLQQKYNKYKYRYLNDIFIFRFSNFINIRIIFYDLKEEVIFKKYGKEFFYIPERKVTKFEQFLKEVEFFINKFNKKKLDISLYNNLDSKYLKNNYYCKDVLNNNYLNLFIKNLNIKKVYKIIDNKYLNKKLLNNIKNLFKLFEINLNKNYKLKKKINYLNNNFFFFNNNFYLNLKDKKNSYIKLKTLKENIRDKKIYIRKNLKKKIFFKKYLYFLLGNKIIRFGNSLYFYFLYYFIKKYLYNSNLFMYNNFFFNNYYINFLPLHLKDNLVKYQNNILNLKDIVKSNLEEYRIKKYDTYIKNVIKNDKKIIKGYNLLDRFIEKEKKKKKFKKLKTIKSLKIKIKKLNKDIFFFNKSYKEGDNSKSKESLENFYVKNMSSYLSKLGSTRDTKFKQKIEYDISNKTFKFINYSLVEGNTYKIDYKKSDFFLRKSKDIHLLALNYEKIYNKKHKILGLDKVIVFKDYNYSNNKFKSFKFINRNYKRFKFLNGIKINLLLEKEDLIDFKIYLKNYLLKNSVLSLKRFKIKGFLNYSKVNFNKLLSIKKEDRFVERYSSLYNFNNCLALYSKGIHFFIKKAYNLESFKKFFKKKFSLFFFKSLIKVFEIYFLKNIIKKFNKNYNIIINFYQIYVPTAYILSIYMKKYLEMGKNFTINRVVYPIIKNISREYPDITGIQICCKGRFTKRRRASYLWFSNSKGIPASTRISYLDFAKVPIFFKYGVGGARIWLVYNKRPLIHLKGFF